MPQCKALTNHVCVSVEGNYKPCCTYPNDFKPTVKDMTPQEWLDDDYMRNIRNNMQGTNWDQGCAVCKSNEESGTMSQRQIYNLLMREPEGTLEFLDYTTSNQCNLACRMCTPEVSSKWAKLLNVPSPNKNNFKEVINSMDTTNLNRISYVGGEPFITGEANEIMDYAAENNLRFHFFTNLTFWPEKFLPKLKQCEKVFASFSIDAIGDLNDYIRHGSDWNTVETIFHKWLDFFDKEIEHSTLTISITVQAYNFHNIPKMKEYFAQYNVIPSFIKIERPACLKINALPPSYIDAIRTPELEPYLKDYKFNFPQYLELKKYTERMDKLLGKNIKDYIPLLSETFEKTL